MQLIKIKFYNIYFLLFCICAVVFPVNYEFLGSFRFLDIVFIILFIFFTLSNPKVNKSLLIVLILAIFFFTLSSLIGIFQNGFLELSRLGFIYKYLFIFTVPWLFVSIVKTKEQIRTINWILIINFIFLSSWTYIYLSLLASGAISGSFRPSFPLSNDYIESDAHLYSSYLGFFVVAYLFYLRRFFNHNLLITIVIAGNGIVGLLLTGSRTGLVLVGLSIFIYFIYFILKLTRTKVKAIISKKAFIYSFLSIFFILLLAFIFMPSAIELFSDYERLTQRAFNFDLAADQSSQGRIYKLLVGIEDSEYSGLLLGLGLHSSLIWYDGLFTILLAHGGILFIISVVLFYSLIIKKAYTNSTNQKEFLLFCFLVFLYVIANLITEYIFVSRNAFPVLVLLSVLYVSILNNKRSSKVNNSLDRR